MKRLLGEPQGRLPHSSPTTSSPRNHKSTACTVTQPSCQPKRSTTDPRFQTAIPYAPPDAANPKPGNSLAKQEMPHDFAYSSTISSSINRNFRWYFPQYSPVCLQFFDSFCGGGFALGLRAVD